MANVAIFGGAGYFTGASLGNLLTINKIRIISKNVKLQATGGAYLWSQSDPDQREFGVLYLREYGMTYNYGGITERTLLTAAEMLSIFGSYEPNMSSFSVEFDLVANTFEVFVNGTSRKSGALIRGTARKDNVLFRIGARGNGAAANETTGATILKAGCQVGDTDIYINDVLVRRYIMPNTGTTVPESVGGNLLTQRGTWPGGDTEWGSIVDPQGFTVSQSTAKPGDTISGTYTAWPTSPTASLVLADSAANTLTLTPAVVGGAGDGTWSATIPALPSTGTDVELLKFGATTVSFGGFTAKAGPTLQVAATQTLATLASGFDDYVFQGWLPQPAVGDQLVTVTADGIFNSNGDYTFYAEGVYPVWYVDGTGQVYGRTIDTSGLSEPAVSLSSDLTPGATITATLVNYPSLPTTVTIADSRGNDIVRPLTATGATTATFTVPALASSNAGQEYIQFGAVNLTFGAKTISSTFNPVSPLSYVTLIAPVATNAFEAWGPDVPVAGEQLISEGNFDINGNFTGADPEAIYTCWITRLNGANHRFTIEQGLTETPSEETSGGIFRSLLRDVSRSGFRNVFK